MMKIKPENERKEINTFKSYSKLRGKHILEMVKKRRIKKSWRDNHELRRCQIFEMAMKQYGSWLHKLRHTAVLARVLRVLSLKYTGRCGGVLRVTGGVVTMQCLLHPT